MFSISEQGSLCNICNKKIQVTHEGVLTQENEQKLAGR